MKWRGSGFVVLGVWWIVAVVVGAGVLIMGLGHIRLGGQVVFVGFTGAAVVRAVVRPERRAGGLHVRNRVFDVIVLVCLGVGVLIASATVNLNPGDRDRLRVPPTSVSR